MIMAMIRWPIGQLILLIDWLTTPRRPSREPNRQAVVDQAVAGLALYQYKACPFCVKTRRAMRRLGVDIELRDAKRDPQWRQQLLQEGGRLQVPCLYIPGEDGQAQWLYESDDIIALLDQRVAAADSATVPG
jgi:glutaredoxin